MKIVTWRMKKRQVSDTLGVGMLLALAGGFLDIYSYLARGKVFANAQTGNMVLLGVNIAERNIKGAFYYLIPICAFIIGIILSQIIKERFKKNQQIHWRQITVALEAAVLFVVMFIPQGEFNMVANVCISFVCSMQVQSFRKVHGNVYATTMCTGNLRSATEQLCNYRITKDRKNLKRSLQYYFIILIFIVGAIIGAFFTRIFQEKAVGLVGVILSVVFFLMFY